MAGRVWKLMRLAALFSALAGCGRNAWQGQVQTLDAPGRRVTAQTPLEKTNAVIRQTNVISGGIISADRAYRVRFDR